MPRCPPPSPRRARVRPRARVAAARCARRAAPCRRLAAARAVPWRRGAWHTSPSFRTRTIRGPSSPRTIKGEGHRIRGSSSTRTIDSMIESEGHHVRGPSSPRTIESEDHEVRGPPHHQGPGRGAPRRAAPRAEVGRLEVGGGSAPPASASREVGPAAGSAVERSSRRGDRRSGRGPSPLRREAQREARVSLSASPASPPRPRASSPAPPGRPRVASRSDDGRDGVTPAVELGGGASGLLTSGGSTCSWGARVEFGLWRVGSGGRGGMSVCE